MDSTKMFNSLLDEGQNAGALLKDDNVATSGNVQLTHGTGGLFSNCCLEREVVNGVLTARGLDLPAYPTLNENPLFATLTGYGGTIGDEPEEPCEPGPRPGLLEICRITFPLGRKAFSSGTIDPDKIILNACRGDTRDMVLLGGLDYTSGFNGLTPSSITQSQKSDILNRAVAFQLHAIGRAYQTWVMQKKWTGTPANAQQSDGYKEFWGLDNLIKTGWVDAVTSDPCPALDSDVKDFGGECLAGGAGSASIYEYISALEHSVYTRAEQTGLLPVKWVFVMRREIWQELTIIWPLLNYTWGAYRANHLLSSTTVSTNIDGRDTTQMTLDMQRSMTLPVNGRIYPVVLDDGIPHTGAPNPESSIYFIPLTVLGNTPVTYYEYVDYRYIGKDIKPLGSDHVRFWTDDGRYLWTVEERIFCFVVHSKMEPRLILRTPQLAGRIDNVAACPLQLPNDPLNPNDPQTYIHNTQPVVP